MDEINDNDNDNFLCPSQDSKLKKEPVYSFPEYFYFKQ
jgi:hypothetical protein